MASLRPSRHSHSHALPNALCHITHIVSFLFALCVSSMAAAVAKPHTACNLFKIYLYHITHITCPYRAWSIHIHYAHAEQHANVNLHFKFYLKQEKKHENSQFSFTAFEIHYKGQRRKSSSPFFRASRSPAMTVLSLPDISVLTRRPCARRSTPPGSSPSVHTSPLRATRPKTLTKQRRFAALSA